MLRTTEDLFELKRWASTRNARPCRDEVSGRPLLALPGQPGRAAEVGWDEFEATFRLGRALFVYDDAPGGCRCFVGPAAEAHAFILAETTGAACTPRAGD